MVLTKIANDCGTDKGTVHGAGLDWFKFLKADCGSEGNLRQVADSGLKSDIIIDDRSHASYHQQLALKISFRCLNLVGCTLSRILIGNLIRTSQRCREFQKTVDVLRHGQSETTRFLERMNWCR
jgi:hypothetical protein